MESLDDLTLLREYAAHNSEAAFAEVVSRRVGFVYGSALRQVRDPHLAEEITQAVFIVLAQKAGRISDRTILAGWLFKTTRYTAIAQTRAVVLRQQREQEAHMQSEIQQTTPDLLWEQMSPLLDEALASLGETDRQAVLLRFFENKSLAEVGNKLGTGEDTARKRVARALEKLHRFFSKHGVGSTTAILAGAISANSIQAAPVTLAKTVTAVAIAKGAAASGSTLTLIKGALKIMAWTKAKTAVVIGVGVLLAAGTASITVKLTQSDSGYSWQVFHPKSVKLIMEKTTPQVTIVPTKFPHGGNGNWSWTHILPEGMMGMNCTAEEILRLAFSRDSDFLRKDRLLLGTDLPAQGYDFFANLQSGSKAGLQLEIRRKLGLIGNYETHMTEVLALREGTNQTGLRTGEILKGVVTIGKGGFGMGHPTMLSELAQGLDHRMELPVTDQTSLTNHFDLNMTWSTAGGGFGDELKKFLHNQLGLELVPSREPIEMLMVEKVK